VINSNFGPVCRHFRDTTTYRLKHSTENCSQTAADRDMATIDSLYKLQKLQSQRPIRWYHRRPSTTYRLATTHLWQTDGQTCGQTDNNSCQYLDRYLSAVG